MMEKEEAISLLATAYPALGPSASEQQSDAAQEQDHEIMARLARLLIENVQKGETASWEEVFSVIEFCIIEGSPETRDLLVVGLLENLKNFASWQDMDYAVFEPWLKPETHIAWRWLEKKWKGSDSLADAVRKKSTKS
jgi:hypothetical protein